MELKEQIEQLEKDFNNRIQELKQQINKPKIEVGKVYRIDFDKRKDWNFLLAMVTKITNDRIDYYGFNEDGDYRHDWCSSIGNELVREATPEEWTTALTKYADELYKYCDRVDRRGLDIRVHGFENITKLDHVNNGFDKDGFWYKGRYVMDKHGNFAKGLKAEVKDYDVEIIPRGLLYNPNKDEPSLGFYKLVRVD